MKCVAAVLLCDTAAAAIEILSLSLFFKNLCIFDNFGTLVFAVFMSVWGKFDTVSTRFYLLLLSLLLHHLWYY